MSITFFGNDYQVVRHVRIGVLRAGSRYSRCARMPIPRCGRVGHVFWDAATAYAVARLLGEGMDVGGGERNGQAGERIASRLSRWRRGVIFALLAAAIVERVAWSVASSAWSAGGEAFLVAYAFSQGHGFASA